MGYDQDNKSCTKFCPSSTVERAKGHNGSISIPGNNA